MNNVIVNLFFYNVRMDEILLQYTTSFTCHILSIFIIVNVLKYDLHGKNPIFTFFLFICFSNSLPRIMTFFFYVESSKI